MQIKTTIPILLFLLTLLLCNAKTTFSQSPVNAGFVSGIWFSENKIIENQSIRIYSAIQNNSGYDIIGKVEFFDNESLIGQTNFSTVNGRLIEVWVDWKPTKGTHNIYAKIIQAQKSQPGMPLQNIILEQSESQKKQTNAIPGEIGVNKIKINNYYNNIATKTATSSQKENFTKQKNITDENSQNNDTLNNDALKSSKQKISDIAQKTYQIASSFAKQKIVPLKERTDERIKILDKKQSNNKTRKTGNQILSKILSLIIWISTNKTIVYAILCGLTLLLVYAILKLFQLVLNLFRRD